uniref:Uncharacterized protein n=1 Tax=Alexandrium monilatum TaxID=311494 RepID=A0A7S4RYH8_9DINO
MAQGAGAPGKVEPRRGSGIALGARPLRLAVSQMAPLMGPAWGTGAATLKSLADLDRRRQTLYRCLGICRAASRPALDAEAVAAAPAAGAAPVGGRRRLAEEEAPGWEIVDDGLGGVERSRLPCLASSDSGPPRAQRLPDSQTVTIFDWDDTLLCTSFLVALQDDGLPAPVAHCLSAIASMGQRLLRRALQCGRTFIITNAGQGWVEHSAAAYAPELLPILREVCVISARRSYEAQYPNEVGKWKVQAFLEVQRQLDSKRVANLISLGDSKYEMDAVHVMGRKFSKATVKTIKFLEKPRPEALLKQLKLVAQKFKRIVEKPHSLQISLGPSCPDSSQAAAW